MEEKISFQSDGLKISGLIDTPANHKPGERRPAFVVLHGFGGNKDGQGQSVVAKQFAQWGYVTLRIDFRGCGESEGEHGRIICLDQVADTRNAISYLSTRPEVDPGKIALVGSSFGAAVAVFTGGADRRVAAVISCGCTTPGACSDRSRPNSSRKTTGSSAATFSIARSRPCWRVAYPMRDARVRATQ